MNKKVIIGVLIVVIYLCSLQVAFTVDSPYTVSSAVGSSMKPTMNEGYTIVIEEKVPVSELDEGDIISYEAKHSDKTITHRIYDIDGENVYIDGDNRDIALSHHYSKDYLDGNAKKVVHYTDVPQHMNWIADKISNIVFSESRHTV